mmetsp:Transcript_9040/g.16329  ORF Transcript_9040/g.16329 Transcript_9040/m.16329 type:complete len:220 (-) Transcript_9040:138-797(-)
MRIRTLLQQLGNVIHAYALVEVESLGVDQVDEYFGEFAGGVVGELECHVETTAQLVVASEEEVHFRGKSGEDDQRGVPPGLVGVDAAHDFVHRVVSRILRPGPLGSHAQSVRLVDEEYPTPGLLQHLPRLRDGPPLIGRDQIHPLHFEKLGLSQYPQLVVHFGEETRDGRLARAGISEEDHVGGAGTSRLVREGDAEHGGGEAADGGAVVGEEGFAEVA